MENKKIQSFNKLNKHFGRITKKIDFLLYLRILEILKKTIEFKSEDKLKMLAVQIKNYSKGYDLEEVCKSLSVIDQKVFNEIRHLIEPTTLRILKEDDEISEIIFRNGMMALMLFSFRYGKEWIESVEFANIEKFMLNNKNKYKDLDNIDKYLDVVDRFNEKYGK